MWINICVPEDVMRDLTSTVVGKTEAFNTILDCVYLPHSQHAI